MALQDGQLLCVLAMSKPHSWQKRPPCEGVWQFGQTVDDALAATQWPYPAEQLAMAVRRGYQQLPRGTRQLPLI